MKRTPGIFHLARPLCKNHGSRTPLAVKSLFFGFLRILHFSWSCAAVYFDVQVVHTTPAGQRTQIASIILLRFYEQGMVTLSGLRDSCL